MSSGFSSSLNELPKIELPDAEELMRRGSCKWSYVQTSAGQPTWGAGVAEMDFSVAAPIADRLRSLLADGVLGYMPAGVLEANRQACAEFAERSYGWKVNPDWVDSVPTVLSALQLTIDNLTRPGSAVVVPTPNYMPFLKIPGQFGRRCIEVDSPVDARGNYHLDLVGMEEALQAGAGLVILCNPWNPTGRVLSEAELREFGELVCRYDALVFSDEIHAPLTWGEHRHTCFASLDARFAARTVTAMAASKGWNIPGLPCAQAIIADPDLRGRWEAMARPYVGTPVPWGAMAQTVAYSPQCQPWLQEVSRIITANLRLVSAAAARLPGVRITRPEGTYLTWWDCRELAWEDPAQRVIDQAQVAISPGVACGSSYRKFFRFNAASSPQVVTQMLDRIVAALS